MRASLTAGVSPAGFYTPHDPIADGDTVFLGLPLGTTRAYDNRGITNCSGTSAMPRSCRTVSAHPSRCPGWDSRATGGRRVYKLETVQLRCATTDMAGAPARAGSTSKRSA